MDDEIKLDAVKQNLADAEETLADVLASTNNSKQEEEAIKARIELLKISLSAKEEEWQKQKDLLVTVNKELEEARIALGQARIGLSKAQSDEQMAKEHSKTTHDNLEQFKADVMAEIDQQKKDGKRDLEALKVARQEQENALTILQRDIVKTNDDYRALLSNKEKLEKTIIQLNDDLRDKQNELNQAEVTLAGTIASTEDRRNERAIIEQEARTEATEVQALNDSLSSLTAQIADLEDTKIKKSEELDNLSAKVMEISAREERLTQKEEYIKGKYAKAGLQF